MKILVTGGCGFIGHHFVQHIIKSTNWDIIILDKLTYSCKGLERLRDMDYLNHPRIKIFTYDLINELSVGLTLEIGDIDIIVHMAAETHVDNSISDPKFVVKNNIISTLNLLEYARTIKKLKCFFYFSTDEVFGPAPGSLLYKEWDRHNPTNPYSASKSASENLCLAYLNTYKIPLIIVNVMNVIGERQDVEKYVPLLIKKIINDETIFIHSDKDKNPGSRFYIHARNVADAVLFILNKGKIGEKYNITGEKEIDNLQLAQFVANIIGKQLNYELMDVDNSNRPGHDLRYGLDGTKLFDMGWKSPIGFEDSLTKTILWTLENKKWIDNI